MLYMVSFVTTFSYHNLTVRLMRVEFGILLAFLNVNITTNSLLY